MVEVGVDVAIVGAGLSGLVSARRLVSAGKRVVVLEASHRVGGRMFGRDVDGVFFDLGGQWLGPGQDRVAELAKELGIATEPTPHKGAHLFHAAGRLHRYRGTIPRMGLRALLGIGVTTAKTYGMSMRVPLTGTTWSDAKTITAYDEVSVEDAILKGLLPEARGAFDAAFRAVFGAEARDVSLLWYLFYVRAGGGFFKLVDVEGGAQERKFVGGAYQLATKIAAELGPDVVKLDSPVSRIKQEEDPRAVAVFGPNGDEIVRARRAIVAVPPSLVHARIALDPPAPKERQELAAKMRMGASVKVIAFYKRAFWRDDGLSGQAATDGLLSVVFDNTNAKANASRPALVAFIVGDEARRWASRTAEDQRAGILDHLATLFGSAARDDVTEIITHDWCAEKWTGGCPVDSPPPGALANAALALREPHGLLHWAGTETATKNPGYLDGAVSAGERAAQEVSAAL